MALNSVELQRRNIRWMSWSGAGLIAGILVVGNFIFSYIPIRLDTSDGRVYSISRGTKEILKQIDDRMVIRSVFSSGLPATYKLNQKYVEDLLSEYRRASKGKISVEYLDPSSSGQGKASAMNYGVSPVQLDVRERDRREVKECFMGISFQYGDRTDSIPIVQDTNNLEYEITSRIRKLLNPKKPKIGLVSNNDALTLSSKSLETLSGPLSQIYDIQNIDLASPVPAGIQSVWLIGPKSAISPEALANLENYSSSGGVVGLLVNNYSVEITKFLATPMDPGVKPFLDMWGLSFKPGFVVDQQSDRIQIQAIQGAYRMVNIVDYPYFPWVIDLNRSHPTTKNLDGISLPFTSAIDTKNLKPGFIATTLGRSSNVSYLDPKPEYMNPLGHHERTADMTEGPFDLAILVEGKFPGQSTPSRLVLFGTSHFIESDYPPRQGNYSLLANLMDWSAQDEILIQIRSRGFERRPLKEFSDGMRAIFKLLLIFTLPILTLVIGVVVWRRQKIRRMLLPLKYQEN